VTLRDGMKLMYGMLNTKDRIRVIHHDASTLDMWVVYRNWEPRSTLRRGTYIQKNYRPRPELRQ
jgi:hypothetical protein